MTPPACAPTAAAAATARPLAAVAVSPATMGRRCLLAGSHRAAHSTAPRTTTRLSSCVAALVLQVSSAPTVLRNPVRFSHMPADFEGGSMWRTKNLSGTQGHVKLCFLVAITPCAEASPTAQGRQGCCPHLDVVRNQRVRSLGHSKLHRFVLPARLPASAPRRGVGGDRGRGDPAGLSRAGARNACCGDCVARSAESAAARQRRHHR